MKILFLTPGCFDKGGISRYSRYQIQSLREIFGESNIRVFSFAGPCSDSFEEGLQVAWHGNAPGGESKVGFAAATLRNAVLWRPNVVHVAHVNFSGLALLAAKLCGAKALLNTYGLEVWSGLTKDAEWGLRACHYVLSDCHFTARYLEEKGIRAADSVRVIWDCVDNERFQANRTPDDTAILQRYGIPPPEIHPIVMTLGRLSPDAAYKGYSRLITAFAAIAHEFDAARLVIAGRGALKEDLAAQAAESGIAKRVIFTGMVDDDHLPALYRASAIFSLVGDAGNGRGEGIPLAPLEAMACGAPILVGNQDGSQEAVIDGRNGFILDPFDRDAHVTALRSLLTNGEMRGRLAQAGAEIAKDEFSYRNFREKHRRLYETIGAPLRP